MALVVGPVALEGIERHRSERRVLSPIAVALDPLATMWVFVLIPIDDLHEQAVRVQVAALAGEP